jgi:GxxExxY protein
MQLEARGIPHDPFKQLALHYKGRLLKTRYIADYECYEQIIVELKALERTGSAEVAQLLNYLKATGHRVGLLINFGSAGKMEWKRLVN